MYSPQLGVRLQRARVGLSTLVVGFGLGYTSGRVVDLDVISRFPSFVVVVGVAGLGRRRILEGPRNYKVRMLRVRLDEVRLRIVSSALSRALTRLRAAGEIAICFSPRWHQPALPGAVREV